MSGTLTLALAALTLAQAAQTDTTFPVGEATRLEVDNAGGSILVTGWDRPEIRIQAEHSTRTYVDIDRRGSRIDVEAEARRGPATIVDYRITVPSSLTVELDGHYSDITVEGVDGEVEAETMAGDVLIRGGRGTVKAGSVNGKVDVEGAQGRVEVESVSQPIRIVDSGGEIYAESVGGTITLENVQARVVEAGTVGGRILFSGPLAADGHYFFGTHGGSIRLEIPQGSRASFHVATIHGSVTSDLPGAPSRFPRGERHSFDLNGGGALVEVESFGGRILLVRPGSADRPEEGAGPASHDP